MASSARRRTGGPSGAQWMALGGAVLVILGLTFALGLLVGRQWARQTTSSALIASILEPAKKPAPAARRGGIAADTMADRAPEPTEKLTFYKTLTEPLDGPGGSPKPEAKPVAVKIPAATPPPPPAPAAKTPPAASAPSLPPAPGKAQDSKATNRAAASASGPAVPYTIQVGAFKNRRQADDSRQQLVGAGLDAYVVTLAAQEGVARYRVRVGTYRPREEAAAA
ncbi:MAG TPA: SPOR domain-containing protein, partial [Methylomirabilota bacterium]